MKNEAQIACDQFSKALERLEEVVELDKTEIIRDSAIQRFEFTYEAAWKTLKQYFRMKGEECDFPRDAFKLAFKFDLITEEELYLEMIKDRNITSHEYGREKADEIFEKIRGDYSRLLAHLHKIMKEKIKDV